MAIYEVGTTLDILLPRLQRVVGMQHASESTSMGDAMKILQNSDGRQTTLIFTGALDLPNAGKVHQALSEAIRNFTHVAVHIQQVTGMDLSFLQLICSAHRTAISQKKHFSLSLEGNDRIKEVLMLSSFDRHCGCGSDDAEPCIWQTAASNGN